MRDVSAAFLAAVAGSHRIVAEVDVLYDGVAVAEGIAVAGGSVTLDRTAQVRGRCDVQIADMVPTEATDLLTPYGYELRVRRGVAFQDGTTELVSLGVFGIQQVTVGVDELTVVTGLDRSQWVRDWRLEEPFQVAAGNTYDTAIASVLAAGSFGPSWANDFRAISTPHTTPLLTFDEQADRWDEMSKLAEAVGCELFFDGDGVLTMREEPDPSTDPPVWSASEGGVLVDVTLGLDRATAYNKVVATGENAANGATYRGTATDDDPASPSYYYGPFGRKPRFYASPFIASDAQATSAAEAMLLQSLGVPRSLSFSAVVNPALEPGDVITVRREALGVDEVHVLDALTIPLDVAAMSATTRTRQGFG